VILLLSYKGVNLFVVMSFSSHTLSALSDHLRHHWFFLMVQLCAVGFAAYWWRHLPAPGYAIGVLAVLAAVMSIHSEMRRWHKAVWMLLIGAFLFLEFRAIDQDRRDNETKEAGIRKEERSSFAAILKQNQDQFDKTMNNLSSIIQSSADVAKLSKENVDELTGGNSYAVVVPIMHPINAQNDFRLVAYVAGTHRLSDVQIYVTKLPDKEFGTKKYWEDFLAGKLPPPVFAGTLNPSINQLLPSTVNLSSPGITEYVINVFARNRSTVETLRMRLNSSSNRWEYSCTVKREVKQGNPSHDATLAILKDVPWTTTEIYFKSDKPKQP
jgi:hypothetical protein